MDLLVYLEVNLELIYLEICFEELLIFFEINLIFTKVLEDSKDLRQIIFVICNIMYILISFTSPVFMKI